MFIEIELTIFLIYAVLGTLAGIIAGLMGIGGGIIIVPTLLFIFVWQKFPAEVLMHMAVATSLATIVFTSISSTLAHHRKGAVLWSSVISLVPGIVIGSIFGAIVADYLPSKAIRIGFGIFEILVAIQIGIGLKPSPKRELPGRGGLQIAGGGIGVCSSILGIGGGTLTVPFLLWCNVNIRNAVATSSACGFPIAFAGAIVMAVTGMEYQYLPEGSSGYIYWPAVIGIVISSILCAPVGARMAHMLPVETLRRLFAVFLVVVGVRMLI